MPNDQFSVKMLYPTYTGSNAPKSWFIKNGFEDDPRVRLDERVSGNGTDGYKLNDNSKVRFTVSADSRDVDIECDNDFADSTRRGYVYKPNDWMGAPNTGVEMTMFVWCSNVDQSDSTVKGNPVIWKGPTGEHHSNTDCCSGSSHMVHVGGENEDLDNRIAMRLSKEMWHVSYHHKNDYRIISGEDWAITDSRWFGVKYIVYKTTVNNVKSVGIETWLNPNGDRQTWKKIKEASTIDSGGWGDDGDECNGRRDDPLAFGNARMMWRWDHRDGNDLKFRWASIRPIDPRADFDEDPVNPPTNAPTVTSFRTTLRLNRNINSKTGQGCGVPGNQIFFQILTGGTMIERSLCDTSSAEFRTIIACRANPAGGSSMRGRIPKEALFELRRNGAGIGTCRAKIWDTNGIEKYQSTNTITVSTLPTTFDGVFSSFDMSTNTYTMQNGDRIGVQYTASSDPSDCVLVRCKHPGDGSTGTYYANFNNGTGQWGEIQDRDVLCQLWA